MVRSHPAFARGDLRRRRDRGACGPGHAAITGPTTSCLHAHYACRVGRSDSALAYSGFGQQLRQ